MEYKTGIVDGRSVDIINEKKFLDNLSYYGTDPSSVGTVAMETTDNNGNPYILPIRNKTDDRPGVYIDGFMCFASFPKEYDQTYTPQNPTIVDFSNTQGVNEFLQKNEMVRSMEAQILTDADSITMPNIKDTDTDQMKLFKEAIILKHIDLDKYKQRFGVNYLNDKRTILNGDDITLKKMIEISQKLDIEVELTLRDAHRDTVNPMNKEISSIVTTHLGEK